MYIDTTSYLNSIGSSSTSSTASSSLGKDDFIKILVAQLETQDPFNSMDEKEMISQLTQFSVLEQMTNMNETLSSAVDLLTYQSASSSVAYIGKSVMASGYTLSKEDGAVTTAQYTLDSDAASLKAYVYAADGSLVDTVDIGAKSAGDYTFKWDGLDANGDEAADGSYSLAFAAADASGNELSVSTMISGVVSGVSVVSGVVKLTLEDGREVNLADVTSVTNPDA